VKVKIMGQARSWFRDDCSGCCRVFDCVGAYFATESKVDYLLHIRGYKRVPTELMLKGIEMHENLTEMYETVDEYGAKTMRNDFLSGKEVILKEVGVCSRKYGMRGVIDVLKMTYDKKSAFLEVIEIKPVIKRQYWRQVAVYATILSDPEFEIRYIEKRGKKQKKLGIRLLPDIPLKLNITVGIYSYKKNRIYSKAWMENGKMTKWARGISAGIQKRAKIYRKLHKYDIYIIPELESEKKTRQRFLGRRKILVKSKPKVRK